jgi:photosystem II stability/assembly factor-like uncharacterized protein
MAPMGEMKRFGLLVVVLAALAATILAAGCSWGADRKQPRSPSSAPSGVTPTSPTPSVSGSNEVAPPGSLAGSFVMDLTWVSARTGCALAATSCARGLCPEIAHTGNGGRSWRRLSTPPGFIQGGRVDCSKKPCAAHIRFATASVGYLFGPALFVTRNGGRSWSRAKSAPVEALEPSLGTAVRIVYDHTGCPGPCHRTVEETRAGSPTWRTLLRLGFPRADSREAAAQVVRQGSKVVYVPIYGDQAAGAGTQHAVIFRSLDAGRTWRRLEDPCGGSGLRVFDAVGLAAAPGGVVAALCVPRSGALTPEFVCTSTDFGSSWRRRHRVPGAPGSIAAAGPSHFVVADGPVSGNGPHTYHLSVSTNGGRHWTTVITDRERISAAAPSSAFLGFENARVGRWVGYARAIWTTRDGGVHWIRRKFP